MKTFTEYQKRNLAIIPKINNGTIFINGSPWTKKKKNIKGFLFLGSMSCNNETSDWQDYEGIHTSLWISWFNPLCLKFHFFWTTNTKFCQYHECIVLINHVSAIMSRCKWFYPLKKLGKPEKNLYKCPFI